MKILVVDDSSENLNAAKKAAKKFQEHNFSFITSAAKTLKEMENFEGIITDLFFSPEKDKALLAAFRQYGDFFINILSSKTNPASFQTVAQKYYGSRRKAEEKLFSFTTAIGITGRDIISAPPSQLPYGCLIMLKAKSRAVKHLLVSNLLLHSFNSSPFYT